MILLQFPEFLLLAVPLAFVCWRRGNFRPAWRWLAPIGLWGVAAITLWSPPWWSHLWLLLPAALWVRPWLQQSGITGGVRLLAVATLLLALTGPEWDLGGRGIDVVIVADRSLSMPHTANIAELIQNLERNRRPGDRVGVVTFGQSAVVEHVLSDTILTDPQFVQPVGSDGSDLHAGLLKALELIDPNRPARILVLSDGEANGESPLLAARRAREAGVPVDYRLFEVVRSGDVAIAGLSLPEEISPLQPFQFSVEVASDRAAVGRVTVFRNGIAFVQRDVELFPGRNRIPFRDQIGEGGVHHYEARIDVAGDPLVANNRGEGIVRVDVPPRLLVLNADGQSGNLVRQLQAAEIPVDVAMAAEHPLTQDALDPYRAVILENVPAGDLGRLKLERLAQFVLDLGGGLLLTGGQRSFGVGGYYQSPLEEVLPVSMEMREEHRKTRVAIAIALDRSGSMAMPVPGGKTKMDLADLGTAAVVRLLSPGDSVAVIAVDSAPHVIQPLTDVHDPEGIAQKALKIQSEGGGIFIYEALVAAGNELAKAQQSTRHIILFADAADSEEPGAYKQLLARYEAAGITTSVIGLGTDRDVDAALLQEIATLGKGNILFTEDPQELPRLFTEDTMSVARSTFIEKDPATQPEGIPGVMIPNARLMGELTQLAPDGSFPTVEGYNLSYLRPDATAAVQSLDEYQAPWSALWYRGLGRVAAITFEVDGKFSGSFGRWQHASDFLVTHARWLMSGEAPPEHYLSLTRAGQDAVLTLELDPGRPERGTGAIPEVKVIPPGAERLEPLTPQLVWTGPDTLEARFRLTQTGTYRSLVIAPTKSSEVPRIVRGPVVTLPYSPEFDPREGLPTGGTLLAEVARISGGAARTDVLEVLRDPPRTARTRSMLPYLFTLGLLLLLLEVAGRRLALWEWLEDRLLGRVREAAPVAPTAVSVATRRRGTFQIRWPSRATAPVPASARPEASRAEVSGVRGGPPTSGAVPPAVPPERPALDPFAAAKDRARRRLR